MAIRVVYHGGDGSVGTASSLTPTSGEWATAYQRLELALSGVSSTDIILIHHEHAYIATGAYTLTCPTTPGLIIACINGSTGALVSGPSAQERAGSTGNFALNGFARIHGVYFSCGTTLGSPQMTLGASTVSHGLELHRCRLGTRVSTSNHFGPAASASNDDVLVSLVDCEWELLGSTPTSKWTVRHARVYIRNLTLSSASAPNEALLRFAGGTTASVIVDDTDIAALGCTSVVEAVASAGPARVDLYGSVLPSSGNPGSWDSGIQGGGGPELWWSDCSSGDVHGLCGFASAAGSAVPDTGVGFDEASPSWSWKVTTTAQCSRFFPLYTPWVERPTPASVGSITPRLEILRNNDSTSPYTEGEVYAECSAKRTSGSTRTTTAHDGPADVFNDGATAQDGGAGTGSWFGGSGSRWSGKLQVASFTPAEDGSIAMRGVITAPNIAGKLHISPRVRW